MSASAIRRTGTFYFTINITGEKNAGEIRKGDETYWQVR